MNKLPEIIKSLPKVVDVLNCNICFIKGLRDKNIFSVYADKKFKYFVCKKCNSVHKVRR